MLNHILNDQTLSADDLSINDLERMQLRNGLTAGAVKDKLGLARLLCALWLKGVRWWRTRKQIKVHRSITGNAMKRRKG